MEERNRMRGEGTRWGCRGWYFPVMLALLAPKVQPVLYKGKYEKVLLLSSADKCCKST